MRRNYQRPKTYQIAWDVVADHEAPPSEDDGPKWFPFGVDSTGKIYWRRPKEAAKLQQGTTAIPRWAQLQPDETPIPAKPARRSRWSRPRRPEIKMPDPESD